MASLADSILHPRESNLMKGWSVEASDLSDGQALYINPPVSYLTRLSPRNEIDTDGRVFPLQVSAELDDRVCC